MLLYEEPPMNIDYLNVYIILLNLVFLILKMIIYSLNYDDY